jgi:hypothetical protein
VEVVVCLSLAAVVFGSIATLFLSSRRTNDAAEKYSIASALVRDRLEQLMSLRFDDRRLSEGFHEDDLPPTLPDPATGESPSSVPNVFRRTYRVRQFAIPRSDEVPAGGLFTPVRVVEPGSRYDYKRLDVTVELSVSRPGLGWIGARVSAIRRNPAPDEILSEASPENVAGTGPTGLHPHPYLAGTGPTGLHPHPYFAGTGPTGLHPHPYFAGTGPAGLHPPQR